MIARAPTRSARLLQSRSRFRSGPPPVEFLPALPPADFPGGLQSPVPPAETEFPSSLRLPCPASLRKQKSVDGLHPPPKEPSAAPTRPRDCAPRRAPSRATRPAPQLPQTVPASSFRGCLSLYFSR